VTGNLGIGRGFTQGRNKQLRPTVHSRGTFSISVRQF
jgi:hypothetical protein